LGGKVIIDAAAAAGLIVHLVKYLSFLKPRMQLEAANAQRIFQILPGSRAKSIERNRKCTDFNFAHLNSR